MVVLQILTNSAFSKLAELLNALANAQIMIDFHTRLFARVMSRNREVFLLKIITLATAFASSILITLFSLNEFGYDRFHQDANAVFRVLQRNTDEQYSGNRLSVKIPSEVFHQLSAGNYRDSLVVSRIKIMNKVTLLSVDQTFPDQKIHATDSTISKIFSFEIVEGNQRNFNSAHELTAMVSSQAALKYTGTLHAVGKKIKLFTLDDTVDVKIVAVFKDFPENSHEDFDVFIAFHAKTIAALNFNPEETSVYGRTLISKPGLYKFHPPGISAHSKITYSFQPLPQLYFGPRVLGEEARHGDSYSVIILICLAGLILFLALTSFINLTTITLPHRSKELAIKKLAGTSQFNLLGDFIKESSTLVGLSLLAGLLIIIAGSGFIESILGLRILPLIFHGDVKLILIVSILFIVLALSPVFMTTRFIRATPNRLLSTDTISFPKLKRIITFLQLGISIFLIITSVVIRRQINYSLLKEPGRNHDQIVYLNCPAGITNEGIMNMRAGWKKYNPNILDVMAVSQLPDRIVSKEIGTEFYLLQVDPGFREFFDLKMLDGYWFGPNSGDSTFVTNRSGLERMDKNSAHVLGVAEDLSGRFNQPEKPLKIKLAKDYNYNWLCVRVLEVDIRRTVNRLSNDFSLHGGTAHVHYLNSHFKSWIEYQDRLNTLSAILAILSGLLSCFAIYGLSVSLVRDKLKQIAVHKLFGAGTFHITYLLILEFVRQMAIALVIFAPLTYIFLAELLRTFVYATKFSWLDPVYPIGYCAIIIIIICGFQARSLNRADIASALKN